MVYKIVIGIIVKYRKVLMPEFGIETMYRKVLIPEKGIDTKTSCGNNKIL